MVASDENETEMAEPPAIEIRPATPADVQNIRYLVRAAYAKWIPVIGREPLPMSADYERAVREHQINLLYADGEMVALIEMIPHSDHLYIENVAVLPERRGRGFGRLMLANAEQTAISRGLSEIRLHTNGAFDSNIALYQAINYRIDREEPFMGGTRVCMSKKIGG